MFHVICSISYQSREYVQVCAVLLQNKEDPHWQQHILKTCACFYLHAEIAISYNGDEDRIEFVNSIFKCRTVLKFAVLFNILNSKYEAVSQLLANWTK